MFWPDLASAHYSKETQAWMRKNVKYVPKHLNPPNVPQTRSIEDLWGCLAQKAYDGGWEAKIEQELRRCISSKLREIHLKFVESLMKGVKSKVKYIGQHSVFLYFKDELLFRKYSLQNK